MKDFNRVVLIGRLTKDVELRYSNSGVCFGHFSVAVNRSRKTESGYSEYKKRIAAVLRQRGIV